MTQRKKIIAIYSIVALICVLVLGSAFLLVNLKKKRAEWDNPDRIATDIGKETPEVLKTLSADIELTKQNGEKINISELSDKVWVAAQFYASCPMCAARNGLHLTEIYQEYADNENFRVLCFSIDPEHDTLEHLTKLQENMGVDGEKWWFVKGDPEELKKFMIEQMGYPEIRERTDEAEIAAKGRWAHDLGIEAYDGMDLLIKANLEESPYNDVVQQRALLKKAIEKALNVARTSRPSEK